MIMAACESIIGWAPMINFALLWVLVFITIVTVWRQHCDAATYRGHVEDLLTLLRDRPCIIDLQQEDAERRILAVLGERAFASKEKETGANP